MRKITLLSQKGGVGKSLLATQLAVWATQQDELVCIVDLDPQARGERQFVARLQEGETASRAKGLA